MDDGGDDRRYVCGEVGVEVDVVRGWAFKFGRGWVCGCLGRVDRSLL
jgi:hypothetical protein